MSTHGHGVPSWEVNVKPCFRYSIADRDRIIAKIKRIAAFDCDGTFEREQAIVLVINEGILHGVFPESFGHDFEALRLRHRDRHISFEEYDRAMIDMWSEHVRGMKVEDIARMAHSAFLKHKDWNYRFTKALMREIVPTHSTVMITGAIDPIARLLAPYWGFDAYYGTELEVDAEGRYTGKTTKLPVMEKGVALRTHCAAHGMSLEGSIAIGDTLSDLKMFEVVERPIAFNPDYALLKEAWKRQWPIVLERKDVIFVLDGWRTHWFDAAKADDAVQNVLAWRKRRFFFF
jgi:HAD superfamily phosphoserine phosphatase-like hydrolase